MTRPEELRGERLRDRHRGEEVVVGQVVKHYNRTGDGHVELVPVGEGSAYWVHYLELGFDLEDRFRLAGAEPAGD